jgi:CheY-like chemotaxis protein
MKKEVMIVDDDPGIRRTVSLVLQPCGFQVVPAEDGATCLESLRRGFRGVILMDIMMPGLNGWQTVRGITSEGLHENNLICMLTTIVEPGSEGEDLQEWVFDYLPKPFGVESLRGMVENAFRCLET